MKGWLSLKEASEYLGVHFTTLRRWADAGSVPCFRTPGGHRRFRTLDLAAWIEKQQAVSPADAPAALLHTAVGFARQAIAERQVSGQGWYLAFRAEEDRQEMRDAGRELFGLALQYMGRTHSHEPILEEGRRMGRFYGKRCAHREIGLVGTVRALFFFSESLLEAVRSGEDLAGRHDTESKRIHDQLRFFLDEVTFACLDSYEAARRHAPRLGETT